MLKGIYIKHAICIENLYFLETIVGEAIFGNLDFNERNFNLKSDDKEILVRSSEFLSKQIGYKKINENEFYMPNAVKLYLIFEE